jgi:maltodextrin utilization protein YvdJ
MCSIYSLFHCKLTLNVLGAIYTQHQEYRKLVIDHWYKSYVMIGWTVWLVIQFIVGLLTHFTLVKLRVFTLHKVAKNVSCGIRDWSLSYHLILNLLSY